MRLGKRIGQPLELSLGERGILAVPRVLHGTPDARMQMFRQMVDHIAPFVLLAAMYERAGAKYLRDRAAQRLAAVDDPQPRGVGVEAALDQIRNERAHHARVLGAAFTNAQHVLACVCIEAQCDQHDAVFEVMPSIITTGRRTWSNRDASHCSSRSLLNATKRRDTALFETAPADSPAGSGSSVVA